MFDYKIEILLYILKTYVHRLKELSTYVLAINQQNELTASSKDFLFLATMSQPSSVNFQQPIEKIREVRRGEL